MARARELKAGERPASAAGKAAALLFQHPSLRTKVSFDLAVHRLGGHPIYLGQQEVGLGAREPVPDVARVLERYVDVVIFRTSSHRTLEELARHACIPVVNALSDAEHPCQALADIMTALEHLGDLGGIRVTFVGDGNNCAASLALLTVALGGTFAIASPHGYHLPEGIVQRALGIAQETGGSFRQVEDPAEAVREADIVYTDVWVSMGQEGEAEKRRRAFAGYQVNEHLMALASPQARFLHPMPAHYGEEVPPGFLESRWSLAYEQAENRLHIQTALLEAMLAW